MEDEDEVVDEVDEMEQSMYIITFSILKHDPQGLFETKIISRREAVECTSAETV